MRLTRPLLTALAFTLASVAGHVHAQSLQELYEAARAYDATFLAARSQAQAAEFRAEQANALKRPSAALSANATASLLDTPVLPRGDSNTGGLELSASYPLFNKANQASFDQAAKALMVAKADLETAEQDLIVRSPGRPWRPSGPWRPGRNWPGSPC